MCVFWMIVVVLTDRLIRPPCPTIIDSLHAYNPHAGKYRAVVQVPTDPYEQLHMAIKAVFDSWFTPRAKRYR
jgi:hypothetical protein